MGLFAFLLSLLTGVAFGVLPALQATKFDLRGSLSEEGRGTSGSRRHRRTRAALVVAEIAVALVLLVGAGLLLRSFSALTRVAPGFQPDNLLVVNLRSRRCAMATAPCARRRSSASWSACAPCPECAARR